MGTNITDLGLEMLLDGKGSRQPMAHRWTEPGHHSSTPVPQFLHLRADPCTKHWEMT